MTNTPNNIAGEEWEERFREIWAHIDTPENWSWIKLELKAFISKTRQEATVGERERIKEIVVEHFRHPIQIEHECFKEIVEALNSPA